MKEQNASEFTIPEVGPLDIVIYHVGGDGRIGPID